MLGFFDDIIERVPIGAAAPYLRAAIGERLAESWHEDPASLSMLGAPHG